jgi:hypothetical protein
VPLDKFLEAFWPNLAATIVGVVLGVPIAFWINRRMLAAGERAKLTDDKHQLTRSLEVIRDALNANHTQLTRLVALLDADHVPLDTRLNIAAWEAVKSEVIRTLRDPLLQARFAAHFERLHTVNTLNALHLENILGVSAALKSAPLTPPTKEVIKDELRALAVRLRNESVELIQQIGLAARAHRLSLSPSTQKQDPPTAPLS